MCPGGNCKTSRTSPGTSATRPFPTLGQSRLESPFGPIHPALLGNYFLRKHGSNAFYAAGSNIEIMRELITGSKMRKKFLPVVLSVALALAMTGCGKKSEEAASAKPRIFVMVPKGVHPY